MESCPKQKIKIKRSHQIIIVSLISLALIICTSYMLFCVKITHAKVMDPDLKKASNIQKAITAYMADTGDTALTFGEKNAGKPDFEKVLLKLHEPLEINGVKYEPRLHLPEGSSIQQYYSITNTKKFKGFKITIYSKYDYKVEVTPHASENILVYSDAEQP
ncbi:hypothetical protein [Acetivibrio cellulolyticus]|uniref:hypothetical protein n=1 Tax=Acetivibrio cellulolyticus TaxID=35830 RepID=UPI0001E2EBDD|nr:hypothetical protein [Acetivibrio cellulolyticus]